MNLEDPILNPAADCKKTSEPTLTIDGVDYAIDTLAAATAIEFRELFARVVAASTHNANLLEALEDGSAFRIAFKQPGGAVWTRVHFEDESLLQKMAVEEITLRQTNTMQNLADVLGVEDFTLNNI